MRPHLPPNLLPLALSRVVQIADAPSPRSKPLSKSARAPIDKAIGETRQLLCDNIDQLFLAVKDHIYAILDQMHAAGYEGERW